MFKQFPSFVTFVVGGRSNSSSSSSIVLEFGNEMSKRRRRRPTSKLNVVDSIKHVSTTVLSANNSSDFVPISKLTPGHREKLQRNLRDDNQVGRVVEFPQPAQVHVPIRTSKVVTHSSTSSKGLCHGSRKRRRAKKAEVVLDDINSVTNCVGTASAEIPIPVNDPATTKTEEVNETKTGEKGDYRLSECKVLYSATSQSEYEVIKLIGRGSFGQVVKCKRKNSNEIVAIKILKSLPLYAQQGQVEIRILTRLRQENADQFNLVNLYEAFQHQGHTCLVFEMLAQNLYLFQRQNKCPSLPFKFIRPILQQILTALVKLKEIGIIHLDLKPENIMLVDPVRQPYRVKVIDLGSACHVSNAYPGSYAQSRFYRAPEIILGLPFSEAVDMWSLGCIAAELRLGCTLYPGLCEYDQIKFISQTQGSPTDEMLNLGSKTAKYFHRYFRDETSTLPLWRLKTPEEYKAETGTESRETRKLVLNCLDEIICQKSNIMAQMKGAELQAEQAERREFMDLLTRMLAIDPYYRITPHDALNHAFVTLAHLIDYAHVPSAKESSEIMVSFRHRETNFVNTNTQVNCVMPQQPIQPQMEILPVSAVNVTLGFAPPFFTNQYVLYGGTVEAHQLIPTGSSIISQTQLLPPLLVPPFCQVATTATAQLHPQYVATSFIDQSSHQGVQTSWFNGYPVIVLPPPTETPSNNGTSQQK